MNLKGTIVTWDALNTQKKNVEAVINAHGDYTIPIKANHEIFYNELVDYFDAKRCEEIIAGNTQSQYLTYNEKSHSALIKYECFQTSDIKWFDDRNQWTGLQTIGMERLLQLKLLKRKNTKKEKLKI